MKPIRSITTTHGRKRDLSSSPSLGFTLVELMIVVAIIGLLAALAIPSFSKARSSTQRTLCLENQRVLFGMVTVYEIEQNKTLQSSAGSGVSIRNTLLNAGYIVKKPIFDCPSSDVIDYDDYTLTYVGSAMTGTKCTVQGNNHFLP